MESSVEEVANGRNAKHTDSAKRNKAENRAFSSITLSTTFFARSAFATVAAVRANLPSSSPDINFTVEYLRCTFDRHEWETGVPKRRVHE